MDITQHCLQFEAKQIEMVVSVKMNRLHYTQKNTIHFKILRPNKKCVSGNGSENFR